MSITSRVTILTMVGNTQPAADSDWDCEERVLMESIVAAFRSANLDIVSGVVRPGQIHDVDLES